MKKICFIAAALLAFHLSPFTFHLSPFTSAASAQVVVGLQGGFYQHRAYNPTVMNTFGGTLHDNLYRDTVALTTSQTSLVGGLQVGFQITPRLYVGVAAGILSSSTDSTLSRDYRFITAADHSFYTGQWETVEAHAFKGERSGWTLAPQLKYELARYGNMHFNLLLQGDIRSLGYTTVTESFNKPFEGNEFIEHDPYQDSVSCFSWGVSLRPTLVYEFSQHLSAELSLDFLSVGYVSERVAHDGNEYLYASDDYAHQNTPFVVSPHEETSSTLYAGLNTLMETLRWESPMLRLGFNYRF